MPLNISIEDLFRGIMTILAGIDYSMNSPAICIYNTEDEFKFENLKFYNIGQLKTIVGTFGNVNIQFHKEYKTEEERFRNSTNWAIKILLDNGVESAVIEGYSMGSSSGLVFQIAENTSLIKQAMDLNGIDFSTPSPTQVKKNFCGKGNAKKDAMVDFFFNKFPDAELDKLLGRPKRLSKPIDDIVDSAAVLLSHKHFKEV